MHHTLIAAGLLLVLLLAANANAAENGFYGGVTAGYGYNDFDLEAAPPGSPAAIYDQSEFNSFEYGLLAGYHYNFSEKFFLETELDFALSNGDTANLFGSALQAEKKHTYGINFKPGYQFNDLWGGFVVLGWSWAEYEAEYAPSGFSEAETGHGVNYGFGVNYALNERVTLTGEYTRVQITDIEFNHDPGILTSRFDPELDTLRLALKYHF